MANKKLILDAKVIFTFYLYTQESEEIDKINKHNNFLLCVKCNKGSNLHCIVLFPVVLLSMYFQYSLPAYF